MLLAAQFNIPEAEAAVLQAGIWDLPYVSGEVNAYAPGRPHAFDAGKTGQKVLAIQQIIYLGGKKAYQVELAKSDLKTARLEFEDLQRNLKFQLRSVFFELYFKQREQLIIQKQLANLDTLVKAYAVQVNKGNIPMKDLVRLQSLLYNLSNNQTQLKQQIIDDEQQLQLLLGISDDINPMARPMDISYGKIRPEDYNPDSLFQLSLQARPDYLMTLESLNRAAQNLKWQQSLSVPDLNLGTAYDQRGGAFNNQVNITFGVPLPLWNKNRGNVKMAAEMIKQSKWNTLMVEAQLKSEVLASYKKWKVSYDNYKLYTDANISTFELVFEGVINNFQKRNISIMEFTDFMESYNQSMQQFNEINKNLVLSLEELRKNVYTKF